MQFIHASGFEKKASESVESGVVVRHSPLAAPHRVRYAFDKNNKLFSGTDLDVFESTLAAPFLPRPEDLKCPVITGRLGQARSFVF